MSEVSFKEWVEQKTEEARSSERAQRRAEWLHAYRELKESIQRWLRDVAGERIQFEDEWVQRNEMGLGIYDIDGFRIRIGDSLVRVVPVSRNVIVVAPASMKARRFAMHSAGDPNAHHRSR